MCADWYGEASGKGRSISDALLRYYINRHLERLFGGSQPRPRPQARTVDAPAVRSSSVRATAAALTRASRPLAIIGSQTLAAGTNPVLVAAAIERLGIPVYLSGMARGLLGRDDPLQLRHQRRQALKEADCVILAGVPCDFRLDYGRQIRRSATLIAANRSRKDARLNRRPDIAAIGDAALFLEQLADRFVGVRGRWTDWIAALHARDAAREAEIEKQAAAEGEFVNPIALLREIDRAAGDNAIFVADGGDFVATASYILRPRAPLPGSIPAPSARSASARASRSARRCRGPRRRCGSSSATAHAATALPNSIRLCVTACRSSPLSATTRAGPRSRASR